MNRSTPPSKTSHHQAAAAAAAAASLPFSIDHILSSPIKQAAAVQAAVNQQQAAAMMMMGNQDAVSQAMLNEQLAILSQQQQHLLNPTALAAAAVAAGAQQHHQHQHWQHQQQLVAAAAAANLAAAQQQQQTALSSLNSLNPLAAAVNSAPNTLSSQSILSYFMAHMILQQQQQQQQQQPQLQQHHHQHHNHQQQQQHQSQQLAPSQNPLVQQHRHTGNNHLSSGNHGGSSHISASGSPLKQLTNKSSVYDSIASLTRKSPIPSNHINHRESRTRETTKPALPLAPPQDNCNSRKSNATTPSSNNIRHLTSLNSSIGNLNKSSSGNNDQSTALSSLSNFVTESLAPILNGDTKLTNKDHHGKAFFRSTSSGSFNTADHFNKSNSPTIGGTKSSTSSNQHNRQQHNGNNSQHRKSGSMEPDEARGVNNAEGGGKGEQQSQQQQQLRNPTLDLISSAAQALKSTGAVINTTLAKAPPELVQKQPAWVFCTRYSDRPSSGPRTRRAKSKDKKAKDPKASSDEKRPRTAFTSEQLEKLRQEFTANSYLDERRRKDLAERLCLNENQIKIWFQNKRAKMKKQNNQPNPLRGLLVAGGLYNHSTATSDCSESYANGNDNEDDDDNDPSDHQRGDCDGQAEEGRPTDNNKRRRNDQEDNLQYGNDDETGMRSSPVKRARLNHSGSESGCSDSSRIDDLEDEDERVISVS